MEPLIDIFGDGCLFISRSAILAVWKKGVSFEIYFDDNAYELIQKKFVEKGTLAFTTNIEINRDKYQVWITDPSKHFERKKLTYQYMGRVDPNDLIGSGHGSFYETIMCKQ